MKKFRRIKISFTTTEILASPREVQSHTVPPDHHHCPLCNQPLEDAISSELVVLADEHSDEPGRLNEHNCR